MTSLDPNAFYTEINDAVDAAGFRPYLVEAHPPLVVFGPGNQVDISFDVDYRSLPQWENLVITPSEDEPPRWSARLTNIIEEREVSSHPDGQPPEDEDGPSHDSLLDALKLVASRANIPQTTQPSE